jgi:hypothetical protein
MNGNEERNHENLQFYNHPAFDVAFVRQSSVATNSLDSPVPVKVLLHLPEIRVRSLVAVVFEQDDLNDNCAAGINAGNPLDLRSIGNTIVAYQAIKARQLIARVGEIIGKNGIPLSFPKSRIEGIAFETDAKSPYIFLELVLGNPGINGRWSVYYQACSDNKLKPDEWNKYISQVTGEVLGTAPIMYWSTGD